MSDNTKEFEKNRYFYGKLMTVSDFETEQSYFDGKRHLINRMLHGSGLICGFENITVYKSDGNLKIRFTDGGVALDCCGREIVVPHTAEEIVGIDVKSVPDLTKTFYLYLKYKACYGGYVGSASNPSSCKEKCCPGRIIEGFEVIASGTDPESKELECRPKPEGEESQVESWLEKLENEHRARPSCADKEWVFLATVVKDQNGKYSVNYEHTAKHRIFFTQKELYQLFKCHILDTDNPHQVTAIQTGALVSVEGVSNPGGNIDLVPKDSIAIMHDDTNNLITIGENHSAKIDNPHKVTATQTGALVSIDGVSNPGGNVDLVAGENVTITPNPATHEIKIASTGGGGVINPGTKVQSVGLKIDAGNFEGYAREDHVHNLGTGVVEEGHLSEKLQMQLESLSMYLRERALMNTVSTIKEAAYKFVIDEGFEIAENVKNALQKKIYVNLNAFVKYMDKDLEPMLSSFEGHLPASDFTAQSFMAFASARVRLKELLRTNNSHLIAIQLDEVCFYLSELELSPVRD